MTWAKVSFGRQVGKVTTEPRLAVVRAGGKGLGMSLVIPGLLATKFRWAAGTSVDLSLGMDADEGWLRIAESKAPGARRLRPTTGSQNMRLTTPIWPWLVGSITNPRALEVVEYRIGGLDVAAAEVTLDIRLPAWAMPPPECDGEMQPEPPAPPSSRPAAAPIARPGAHQPPRVMRLADMPPPLLPPLAKREIGRTHPA